VRSASRYSSALVLKVMADRTTPTTRRRSVMAAKEK